MSFCTNSRSTFSENPTNSSVPDTVSQERQKKEREIERRTDGRIDMVFYVIPSLVNL